MREGPQLRLQSSLIQAMIFISWLPVQPWLNSPDPKDVFFAYPLGDIGGGVYCGRGVRLSIIQFLTTSGTKLFTITFPYHGPP